MYYLYDKKQFGHKHEFLRLKNVWLAGTSSGLIAIYLRKVMEEDMNEPIGWHVPIDNLFNKLQLEGNTLVIDLVPS